MKKYPSSHTTVFMLIYYGSLSKILTYLPGEYDEVSLSGSIWECNIYDIDASIQMPLVELYL